MIAFSFILTRVISHLSSQDLAPSIRAWDGIGELLLLAWNSKPTEDPHLSRSAVKVNSRRDWAIEVGIKVDETGRP